MKKRSLMLILAVLVVAVFAFTGCAAQNETAEVEEATEEVEATVEEDAAVGVGGDNAGFTELPISDENETDAEWLHVAGVYFQAVPLTDGSTIDDKDIHIEADISALADNEFGFGAGDWVPYLTVDYKITASDGSVAAEGTFMEMSASDGPHYGANIALPDADTYSCEFTIHSPADNNYLLHTDAETGPGAQSFDDVEWPIVVTFDNWEYVPIEF